MDFLEFFDVSFLPYLSLGKLCEELSTTVGQGILYDTFLVQNTKWLWLVNNIVTTMNSDNMLCGCLGLFPSYVALILNSVKQIVFYVLCKKRLRCASYLEKCVAGKECTFKLSTDNYFVLTSGKDEVIIEFQSRFFGGKLMSQLIFAQSVLKNIKLSSLTYGVVCINKRLTYVTNETLR